MSTSPMLTDSSTSPRNFWSRPEGKAGMLVIAGLIAVFFLYGLAPILAIAAMAMVSLLNMIITGAICVGLLFLLFNKTVHQRIGLIFRLVMRWITGLIVELNPIQILKDRIQEMRKRKESLEEQITNVNAQRIKLDSIIKKNAAEAAASLSKAHEASTRITSNVDADTAARMKLAELKNARHADRLKTSNVSYATLKTKFDGMYNFLNKLSFNLDYFIEDAADQVQQAEIQSKTLKSAFGAYKLAMSIMKGNADENEIYDMAMEKLADDAASQLAFIDESQKAAQSFMDNADLENGVADTKAMADLDAFEQKLLTAGPTNISNVMGQAKAAALPVATSYEAPLSNDSPWSLN